VKSWGRPFASTYQALNWSVHVAHTGGLDLLIRDTRAFVDKIDASLP